MKKNYRYSLVLITFIATIIWAVVARPDINLAMYAIENAYRYPEGDLRVSLATDYLIATERPETYKWLSGLFRNSRNVVEAPNDPLDYTAIQGAYILGSYKGECSLGIMVEILTQNYSADGPPSSVYFIFGGLALKENGYMEILSIARNDSVFTSIRRNGIQALGESGNIEFVEPLIAIAKFDDIYSIRAVAVRALAVLGTSSAIETIEHLAINDPHEYVREEALRVLKSISQ